jgi:hypothetical protein
MIQKIVTSGTLLNTAPTVTCRWLFEVIVTCPGEGPRGNGLNDAKDEAPTLSRAPEAKMNSTRACNHIKI